MKILMVLRSVFNIHVDEMRVHFCSGCFWNSIII
jgi:hypothetical protein